MRSRTTVRNLHTLLNSLVDETSGETITVADLMNAVGRRAFGPLLLLLGFVAISPLTIVPGASWLVAFITLLIAGQVLLGFKHPWLPRSTLDFSFPRQALINGVDRMCGPARMVDKWVKPRLAMITAPPFLQLIALVAIAAALITFPLGLVPFGPVLPGLAILLIGLGVTARDGVVVLLSGAAMGGSLLLITRLAERLF